MVKDHSLNNFQLKMWIACKRVLTSNALSYKRFLASFNMLFISERWEKLDKQWIEIIAMKLIQLNRPRKWVSSHLCLPDIPTGKSGVKPFKTASNIVGLKGFPVSITLFPSLVSLESLGTSNWDIKSTNACKVGKPIYDRKRNQEID